MATMNTYDVELAIGTIGTMDIEVQETTAERAMSAALNMAAAILKPGVSIEINGIIRLT